MKISREVEVSMVERGDLKEGEVYKDRFGNVVIADDMGGVVDLSNGVRYELYGHYSADDEFQHLPDAYLAFE